MKNLREVQVGEVYSISPESGTHHTFICYDYQGGLTAHVGDTDDLSFPILDVNEMSSVTKVYLDEKEDLISFIRGSKGLTTLQDFNIQDENYALLTKMYSDLIDKVKTRHSWEEVMS